MPNESGSGGLNEDYREHVELSEIPEAGQHLLTEYSGFTEDELLPHILAIVNRICFIDRRQPR